MLDTTINRSQFDESPSTTPDWVPRVVKWTSVIHRPVVKLGLTAMHFAIFAYAAYATTDAAIAAGYAHTRGCAARASLFYIIGCIMMPLDWVSMVILQDKELPSPWAPMSKTTLAALHETLSALPATLVVIVIMQMGPVMLWLGGEGLSAWIPALCLQVLGFILHNLCNALTFNFWAVHNGMTQAHFTRRVTTGELTYEEAVSAYMAVNQQRKALARALSFASVTFMLIFAYMAVVLYDFEIRPWGGWQFVLVYVSNCLILILTMNPWLSLNDWPEEFCAEMLDSTELAWTPGERSNFAALVTGTKVKISVLDFEMTHGFRTALPLVFFGWFLYMTELREFHDFQGFPFDQVCYNATAGEHSGHGGHG